MATDAARVQGLETSGDPNLRWSGLRDLPRTEAGRFRHSGWSRTRDRVWAALVDTATSTNRLQNFADCGSHSHVLESVDHPGQYRVAGSTCHDRFCIPCARERSHTVAANVKDQLRDRPARFLTLTLRSTTEPLDRLLLKLSSAFRRLRSTAFWRKRVTGGCAFLEVKWIEETTRWHAHMHVIVQGRYLKQTLLSKHWHRITQDSYVVDIRMARDAEAVANEVAKYATKPLSGDLLHDHAHLCEAMVALKGKRLIVTFGNWQSVSMTAKPDKESWTYVAPLTEMILQARTGDVYALGVCSALGVGELTVLPGLDCSRAPPPIPAVDRQLLMLDQQQVPLGAGCLHLV